MNETPKPIINAAAQKIITSQLLNIPVNSIIFIVLVYINKKNRKVPSSFYKTPYLKWLKLLIQVGLPLSRKGVIPTNRAEACPCWIKDGSKVLNCWVSKMNEETMRGNFYCYFKERCYSFFQEPNRSLYQFLYGIREESFSSFSSSSVSLSHIGGQPSPENPEHPCQCTAFYTAVPFRLSPGSLPDLFLIFPFLPLMDNICPLH